MQSGIRRWCGSSGRKGARLGTPLILLWFVSTGGWRGGVLPTRENWPANGPLCASQLFAVSLTSQHQTCTLTHFHNVEIFVLLSLHPLLGQLTIFVVRILRIIPESRFLPHRKTPLTAGKPSNQRKRQVKTEIPDGILLRIAMSDHDERDNTFDTPKQNVELLGTLEGVEDMTNDDRRTLSWVKAMTAAVENDDEGNARKLMKELPDEVRRRVYSSLQTLWE